MLDIQFEETCSQKIVSVTSLWTYSDKHIKLLRRIQLCYINASYETIKREYHKKLSQQERRRCYENPLHFKDKDYLLPL